MTKKDELETELELWRKAGIEAWKMVERQCTGTTNRLFCPSGDAPNTGTNVPTEDT